MSLLDDAVAAARAGGAKLIEGLSLRADNTMSVTMKSARANIVTWADEASQAAIVECLLERHPDHAILGEEGNAGRPDSAYTWIVDPLDGTTNYARGLSPWGVSIAVRETGGPLLAGVVFDPLRDELYTAARGEGMRADTTVANFALADTTDVSRAVVATGLQNDDPAVINEYARRVEQLHLHCRATRSIGSPAFALAYVATGRLDAFVEKDATYAWDIAAATLMIEELGGVVTDLEGAPPNLGPGIANVVASNRAIHGALLDIVNFRRA